MDDKYRQLRELMARVNGEDTDDCFEAYLKWRNTFDIDHCKALLAERDALRDLVASANKSIGGSHTIAWQQKARAALAL